VILLCLPLLYYSPDGFINLYKQWKATLLSEHEINTGISLMGMLISIFRLKIPVISIQIIGLLFFISTTIIIFIRKNYEQVKAIFLAYLMIWIIIFNQDAESATYIIASTGVAIWYINSSRSLTDKILLGITFILTVLSPTDIFPDSLYRKYVLPFALKALGPSLIWLKIQISLFLPENKLLKNVK
jgi:signal transduction histidine kinase